MVLEAVFKDEALHGTDLPRVIEGAGFGIVEDCGGTGGLETLVKAFKKKKGSDYKSFREWLGVDDFDVTAFDIDDMNFRLKRIPRVYAMFIENQSHVLLLETALFRIEQCVFGFFERLCKTA
jgi:hypothetical protein